MKKTFNVLIIDDHQIILDTYRRAFNFVKETINDIDFVITEAKNCDEAYHEIKFASNGNNIDIVFLDISLPSSLLNKIFS